MGSPGQARGDLRSRAGGIVFALALEALLILMLFTLGPGIVGRKNADTGLKSFDTAPVAQEESAPEQPQAETKAPERPAPQPPVEPVPPQPQPASDQLPPPVIPLKTEQMVAGNIATTPPPPAAVRKGPMGPVNKGSPGDSQLVGTTPNGEPMYAAAWYREPYPDELRGYLSTAQGPGWALITCRTVPDYRVDDCIALAERPEGSNIARAVLAAAWQFRVRPPRVGGRSRVGEWVRIRIDYDLKRQ